MAKFDSFASSKNDYDPPPPKPKEEDKWAFIRDIEDEGERKAAILAKYGFKPRPQRKCSSSSREDGK